MINLKKKRENMILIFIISCFVVGFSYELCKPKREKPQQTETQNNSFDPVLFLEKIEILESITESLHNYNNALQDKAKTEKDDLKKARFYNQIANNNKKIIENMEKIEKLEKRFL